MYLVEVIPFVKGLPKDTLTYFSRVSLSVGEMVSVPLRNRQVPALIVSVTDAREQKATLRHSDFLTRPLKNTNTTPLVLPSFVAAAQAISAREAAPLSLVYHAFLPSTIINNPPESITLNSELTPQANTHHTLQQQYSERVGVYKTLFREALARKESVLLLVPHAPAAEALAHAFAKGAAHHVLVLHGNLLPRTQRSRWQQAVQAPQPIIAIVTRTFLSLPRHDFGLYIVESAGAEYSYRTPTNHELDARLFISLLARHRRARLLYADLVLPPQLSAHPNTLEPLEHSLNTFRAGERTHIIDLAKQAKTAREQKDPFPVLSKEVCARLQKIKPSTKRRHHVLFLVARDGYAPQTLCMDCGTLMRCRHCHAPMSLHGKSSTRFFLCHRCGAKSDAKTLCRTCGSWHLQSYGIGVERVAEFLTQHFPHMPQYHISTHTTKTDKQLNTILDAFFKTPHAFLIATPRVLSRLSYRADSLTDSVIVSLDAHLSAPHFAAEFQAFRHSMLAKEKTKKNLYIQTRTPDHHLIPYLKEGRIAAYLKQELAVRKRLSYPPFATFLTITATGTKATVIKSMQALLPHIQPYKPRIFQELMPLGKNRFALKTLLRLPDGLPPELASLIAHLPPAFHVSITQPLDK